MESVVAISQILDVNPLAIAGVILWTLIWKGFALWRAALLRQKYWFVAMLFINTLGILEIIYLFLISKNYRVEVVEE